MHDVNTGTSPYHAPTRGSASIRGTNIDMLLPRQTASTGGQIPDRETETFLQDIVGNRPRASTADSIALPTAVTDDASFHRARKSTADSIGVPIAVQMISRHSGTVVPLHERTFATSNYKRIYARAKPAAFQHYLLGAVNNVLTLYTARVNTNLSQDELEHSVHDFMAKIQEDAFKNNAALQNDIGAVAEYLWTSENAHHVVKGFELCSVLNAVIRDDVEEEIQAAAIIFRSINSRRVKRNSQAGTFPPNGETWRGTKFKERCKPFFNNMLNKRYRIPGFLATSSKKSVAAGFGYNTKHAHRRAMWHILFDERGKSQPEFRVKHMTFVSKTLTPGEGEYLFAPYSVFVMLSARWSVQRDKPHAITILAACDNKQEDENLPLAPWY